MACLNQTNCNSNNNTHPALVTCVLTSQYINNFEPSVATSATITLTVLNLLLAIVSSLLNLLIIKAISSTPKLQTPTFILLCNLALVDFFVGLLICPLEILYLVSRALQQYGLFCTTWKILVVISYILCPASLYTMTCISFDRYLSLLMRVKYKSVVTKSKTLKTLAGLWVWAILGVTFIALVGKGPFLTLVSCITFLCLAIIADCYFQSFAAIKERQLKIKSRISLMTQECNANNTATKDFRKEYAIMGSRAKEVVDMNRLTFNGPHISCENLTANETPIQTDTVMQNSTKLKYMKETKKHLETVVQTNKVRKDSKEISNSNSERETSELDILSIKNMQHKTESKAPTNVSNPFLHTDCAKFRKTLNTILIIVLILFLCYLPYLVVNTLASLHIINIGIAWDAAAVIVYMNSSISPVVLCTRIPNVRRACARVLREYLRLE